MDQWLSENGVWSTAGGQWWFSWTKKGQKSSPSLFTEWCESPKIFIYIYDQGPVLQTCYLSWFPRKQRQKQKYTCNCFITKCNLVKQAYGRKISNTSFSPSACWSHNNQGHNWYSSPHLPLSTIHSRVLHSWPELSMAWFLASEWPRSGPGVRCCSFLGCRYMDTSRPHSVFLLPPWTRSLREEGD